MQRFQSNNRYRQVVSLNTLATKQIHKFLWDWGGGWKEGCKENYSFLQDACITIHLLRESV